MDRGQFYLGVNSWTGCQDDFAHLEWSSRGKFQFFDQKSRLLLFLWIPVAFLLKTLMKPCFVCLATQLQQTHLCMLPINLIRFWLRALGSTLVWTARSFMSMKSLRISSVSPVQKRHISLFTLTLVFMWCSRILKLIKGLLEPAKSCNDYILFDYDYLLIEKQLCV